MANFEFTVDTGPLAASIDDVSRQINGTTVAVVAMEAAVIEAETTATEEVCQNVNRGFHRLIRSQISQKRSLVQATASSKLLELRRFALSLRRVREQLKTDFERITGRYARLFRSLDEALLARIYRLDSEASGLADQQQTRLSLRISNVGTPTIIHHIESREVSDWLMVSRIKKGAMNVMAGMGDFINKGASLKTSVSEVLGSSKVSTLTWVYAPAILMESDDVYIAKSKATQIVIGPVGSVRNVESVRQGIDEAQVGLNWHEPSQQEVDNVKRICLQKFFPGATTPRLAKQIAEMMDGASWKVLRETP